MIQLGQKAKDKISGFTGIVIGHAEYITGCDQYCIAPESKDSSKIESSQWFDEGRIWIIGDGINPQDLIAQKNGGPNRDCAPEK